MNKIRKILNDFSSSIMETAARFPIAALMTAGVGCCMSYLVATDNLFEDDRFMFATLALFAGALAGCLFRLISEYRLNNRIFELLPPTVLAAVSYFVLDRYHDSVYCMAWYFGMVAVLFALIMWIMYRHNDEEKLLGYLLGKLTYSVVICMVGYGGIMISVLAFHYLIHEFSELYKIALHFYIWINGFLAVMTFLSRIPEKDEEISVSETVNSIVGKVAFYVYLILIAILYLYIVKIIVTWKMPVGRMNWFGSLALLFFVFFELTVQNESGPVQRMFVKWGGLLMLPILAVQLFAIYVRISAYGLTAPRYLSLALILAAVIFIVTTFTPLKPQHGFLALAVISLLVSLGPLNAVDVPVRNQESRLRKTIEKYDGYQDGKLVMIDPEGEDYGIIVGAYDYLRSSDGKLPEFAKLVTSKNLNEFIKVREQEPSHSYDWYSYHIRREIIDIAGYSRMAYGSGNDYRDVRGLDISALLSEIIAENQAGKPDREIIELQISEERKLIITDLSISVTDEEITSFFWEGYVLEK